MNCGNYLALFTPPQIEPIMTRALSMDLECLMAAAHRLEEAIKNLHTSIITRFVSPSSL
jgi:hypothetical protein